MPTASHISDEVQTASIDVPWRKIIGTRIILAHAYFHIDQDIVGSIVSDEVPPLRQHLAAALDALID
jgi:uncharacterized protein with HEPN domain